jgi:hypothetical protein
VTKSIASVRSKVITLNEKFPGTEIQDVIEIISHHLKTIPFTLEGSLLSEPQVQESFNHLRSWEWLFGETPHFEYDGMTVHKGMVNGNKFDLKMPDFSEQHRLSNLIS